MISEQNMSATGIKISSNFVLLDDYKMKVNSLDVGQPEVAVQLSVDTPTV